jgi:hypothetical protein
MYVTVRQHRVASRRRPLGDAVNQAVSSGAAIGGTIAGQAVTSSLVSSGAIASGGLAAGAITAGIGAAVAIVAGLIMGAWARHKARAAGAKNENAAVNSALKAFDESIRAVFDAANSSDPAKHISAVDAGNFCQQIYQQWWANMAPYQSAPGTSDRSHGGADCPSIAAAEAHSQQCNKSCTAGCCVGCIDIYPTIQDAIALFSSGKGGSITVRKVYGSKYGANAREAYTLTFTPPSVTALAAADLGGSVAGIPVWLLLAGGVAAFYALGK